jgi:uncharacterized protein (TIGR04141 family)
LTSDKKTYQLSVYLIKDTVTEMDEIVVEDLTVKSVSDTSKLFYSHSFHKDPKWLNLFHGIDIKDLFTSSASALLLIKVQGRFFALTFGPAGRHFLRRGRYIERFGLIVTLNSVKTDSLKSIDTKTLESEGLQTRIQSAKPVGTEEFGLDIERDLVGGLVGESKVEALGNILVGKDSLRLSVKCDLNDIKRILEICLTQYEKEDYKKEFPWIDNLKEVKDPQQVAALNTKLIEELRKNNPDKLWLTVPEILDWADHGGFKYSKKEKDAMLLDDIHVSSFKEWLAEEKENDDVDIEDLTANYVCRFSESNKFKKNKWSMYECIYFECNHDESTFFLTGGKWYEVKTDLVSTVNAYWASIPNEKYGIDFIDYNHDTEEAYNKELAKKNDALCMDQKNIQIEGRSKFEFCDVYTKDRILIHVKRYSGSSVLSHLFNQGYVSAEMLFDPEFKERINAKLEEGFFIEDTNNQPNTNDEDYTVIFGVVSKTQGDLDLPFFSKLTLMNVAKSLTYRGYSIAIVKIQNIKEDKKS